MSIDLSEKVLDRIVAELNENQRLAVTAPANGRLQIIAGPGTGKTKVLTSRVAFLLLKEEIPPHQIVVTTFTKKAANELTERLELLLGDTTIDVSKILVGTFHSICYRVLMMYGKKLGIERYNIADDRDADHILKEMLAGLLDLELDTLDSLPDEETVIFRPNSGSESKKSSGYDTKKIKRQISKLKSSGVKHDTYERLASHNKALSLFYRKYQHKLQENNLLDFDDCLLYCYLLVTSFPVLNFVQHVLVDEFQDTNEIQLQLMYEFARGHPTDPSKRDNVTIVGDPDQSIYAFRDAQAINFEKMEKHYLKRYQEPCRIISLTENYRSTSDILDISEKIMRQQQKRVVKSLKSQTKRSFKPVYYNLTSAEEEAKWVCYQIEHIMALPNTPFMYSDIAVLIRAAYQTRAIENELVRRRIPYFMIRGRAFWERKEVVAILDYLRVVAHDNDRIAYLRTLNFPKRGFGDKTIQAVERALELETLAGRDLVYLALTAMVQGENNELKLSTKMKQTLSSYLQFIHKAREMLLNLDAEITNGTLDSEKRSSKLAELFELIYVHSGLKQEFSKDENQELNIKEVEKQFCEFVPRDEELPLYHGGSESEQTQDDRNYLARFIHSVGLYETDDDKKENEKKESFHGRVALSTIHGSKGLEWPIVFVPGLSEGLLPARFAIANGGPEAIDEERRCFYVALTRAKTLLYMSSYTSFGSGMWNIVDTVSRFIDKMKGTTYVSDFQDAFKSWDTLTQLYSHIRKTPPSKDMFPFDNFFRLYKERLTPFIKGETFAINEQSFKSAPNSLVYGGMGFSSAAQELGKKRRAVGLSSSSKRRPPIIRQANGTNAISGLNNLTSNVDSTLTNSGFSLNSNKAPKYVSQVAPRPAIASGAKNNKAPAYIPSRQRPGSLHSKSSNRAPR